MSSTSPIPPPADPPSGPVARAVEIGARYIDYRSAFVTALLLGGIVWTINLSHGPLAALPAALKQAAYSFFAAGFIVRLCERLSVGVSRHRLAIALAVIVPSGVAVGLTFLVHSLRGTPEPLQSTIPTMLIGPPSFFWWARRTRDGHEQGQP